MPDLVLTLAALSSPVCLPLLNGEVHVPGLELRPREVSIDESSRAMETLEIDVAEVSIGTFIKARDRGIQVVALPIFTSLRNFPQTAFRINARLGLLDLAEVRGKTVGASQYWTASSTWGRKILRELYHIDAEDVSWVTFQPERLEGQRMPPGVRHRLETKRGAADLAEAGELAMTLTAAGARPRDQEGGNAPPPVMVPAFPDPAAARRDFYMQTGIYPIQHVHVLREALAIEHPWLVARLCDAFVEAKRIAGASDKPAESSSPAARDAAELKALLGDVWPFGIGPNRKTLEAFVQAAYEQGLTDRQHEVASLFAPGLPDSMC